MRAIETLFAALIRHEYARSMSFGRAGNSRGLPTAGSDTRYQLYVHVPFCLSLCPFCSFHRVAYQESIAIAYFEALRTELRRYHDAGFVFDDLYVGGGTPTVNPEQLLATLDLCRNLFPVDNICVETNPTDLRPALLAALRDRGVTRLSVGVQSFDDALLQAMGRYEKYGSGDQIIRALETVRGQFTTLNVDMIFGLPGQDEVSLAADLEILRGLKPEQVSYYPLMVASSTRETISQRMGPLSKSDSHKLFDQIVAALSPIYHRSTAWCFSTVEDTVDEYIVQREAYIGAGCGAFSYIDGTIYATTFSIEEYCQRIRAGASAITRSRKLSRREQMRYDLVMRLFGLRVEKSWLRQRYGSRFYISLAVELLGMWLLGALKFSGDSLAVTQRGEFYWVIMMREFFSNVDTFRYEMRCQTQSEDSRS